MSLRRELYKGRNATPLTQANDDGNNHWVRDWYDPPKVSQKDTNLMAATTGAIGVDGTLMNTPRESSPPGTESVAIGDSATPISISENGSISESTSNNIPPQLHGFQIKTWIISNKTQDSKDLIEYQDCPEDCLNDNTILIPLDEFKYGRETNKFNDKNTNNINGDNSQLGNSNTSISESDIKSAVGGSNSIFNSSAS